MASINALARSTGRSALAASAASAWGPALTPVASASATTTRAGLGLGCPPCKIKPSFVSGFSDMRDASYFINDHLPADQKLNVTTHRAIVAGARYVTPLPAKAEAVVATNIPAKCQYQKEETPTPNQKHSGDRSWMGEPTPTPRSYYSPEWATRPRPAPVVGEGSLARKRTVAEVNSLTCEALGTFGDIDLGLNPSFVGVPRSRHIVDVKAVAGRTAEGTRGMGWLLEKIKLGKSTHR